MGKVIVYCEGCGERLTEDDFRRGKAHTSENRNWCSRCKAPPEAPKTPSRPAIAVPRPSSATPRAPHPPAPPPKRWALFAACAGGAILVVLVVALSGGKKAPPPPEPEKAERAKAWAPSATILEIEAFAATKPDPEALLLRCDEARAKLKGTPDEFRLRAVEESARREMEIRRERGRLDAALRQFRDVTTSDAAFKRREEMARLLRSAAEIAGPRRPEVERLILDYDKAWGDAARKSMEETRADAERLAADGRLSDAFARLEELPESFVPLVGTELGRIRPELERKASEAKERRAGAWRVWAIKSEKDDHLGQVLDEHAGRRGVLCTHPFQSGPASLERDVDLSAGKRWTLSLWVAPHEKGDWLLRIRVNDAVALESPVSPKNSGWKLARVDLSPWAGKRAKLRLEHVATGWEWEHGYWHAPEILEGDGDVVTLLASAAGRSGAIQSYGGKELGNWNQGGAAEWTLSGVKPGDYALELTYSLGHHNGGAYVILAGEASLSARTRPTKSWDDYQVFYPGQLRLGEGTSALSMKAVEARGGLMNLKQIRLYRLP